MRPSTFKITAAHKEQRILPKPRISNHNTPISPFRISNHVPRLTSYVHIILSRRLPRLRNNTQDALSHGLNTHPPRPNVPHNPRTPPKTNGQIPPLELQIPRQHNRLNPNLFLLSSHAPTNQPLYPSHPQYQTPKQITTTRPRKKVFRCNKKDSAIPTRHDRSSSHVSTEFDGWCSRRGTQQEERAGQSTVVASREPWTHHAT